MSALLLSNVQFEKIFDLSQNPIAIILAIFIVILGIKIFFIIKVIAKFLMVLFIYYFNRLIDVLKYPVGLIVLSAIPFLGVQLYRIFQFMYRNQAQYSLLFFGIIGYLVVWKFFKTLAMVGLLRLNMNLPMPCLPC